MLYADLEKAVIEKHISPRTFRDAKNELGEIIKSKTITINGKRSKLLWMG